MGRRTTRRGACSTCPPEASYRRLTELPEAENVGSAVNEAMRAIE